MQPKILNQIEENEKFSTRHIGPNHIQIQEMLATLKINSLETLVEKTVPKSILKNKALNIGSRKTEEEALTYLYEIAKLNKVFTSMIGMGYHNTITPKVIVRNVLENPSWYTAYTPYQAEISQGRLEALLNFQQLITDLTGMELANASLLDEGTAAAEAMSMAKRVTKSKGNIFFVDKDTHPQTIAIIQTRAAPLGFEIKIGDPNKDLNEIKAFGILLQYPGSSGEINNIEPIIKKSKKSKFITIVATDLLALCLLKPPGEMGADIVLGNSQRFGVPLGYGGPHAAFFATRKQFQRSCPGRIIGVSVDKAGKPALRMALQTREQHIRRDKATSNICTAQVLLAITASFYAVYHGPIRLKQIADKVHYLTKTLAEGLKYLNYKIVLNSYFDTLKISIPGKATQITAALRRSQINIRIFDLDHVGISLDETTKKEDLVTLLRIFADLKKATLNFNQFNKKIKTVINPSLRRKSSYLTHPVFNSYHSETEMLRYLRRLSNKDMALDRGMIPLGSCTMKLNSTTEMIPITWRNFNAIHPFAPLIQTRGYQRLFKELEKMLCEITGFDSVSLQPNAGSQGEYAGLMTIAKYHDSRGQGYRNVCLIPSSAHGTNPASAVMAGMDVVVVECDKDGNTDILDLQTKCQKYRKNLAALMITYPSTHGVFEEKIREICCIVHQNEGQVYLDGANLNAMIGLCQPGSFGADVSHINLHKTFCIPHGGGGPGVGPIGVKNHLAPFLPSHSEVSIFKSSKNKKYSIGTISSAPWGSASILPISWAYIFMMGKEGLKEATKIAILNANYIAKRLGSHYPLLYKGRHGLVAHECILDLRPLKQKCGITADDVAKRLVDYGFHAPTMSFPVPDTLMIEPTESENKRELDRFCEAMISIRDEIHEVENGTADRENNLLRNAPHTHHSLVNGEWSYPYSKEKAFFPINNIHDNKFWPPVSRIDNVYGDRNLNCSCVNISSFRT